MQLLKSVTDAQKEHVCILVRFSWGAPVLAPQFAMLAARAPAVITRACSRADPGVAMPLFTPYQVLHEYYGDLISL